MSFTWSYRLAAVVGRYLKSAGVNKTVYHGTNKLFDKFNPKQTAQGILWFSEDRAKIERGESGAESAKYIITAEISVEKTAGWPEYEKLVLAQIKAEGYDSIKLDDDWVVFDPKRVKILKVEEQQSDGTYKVTRDRMTSKKALEQYVGEHSAPDPEVSAPLNDLTFNEIYPDDVYTNPRHYFSGEDKEDALAWYHISNCHKRPSKSVKVYRAVPYQESSDDLISKYIQEKAYIQKTGKIPRTAVKEMSTSDYYEYLNSEIERLKEHPYKSEDNIKRINPGDWVTIVHKYAVDHGRGNLSNKFKVLSKTVLACHLWTDGNSLLEWGYNPGVYLRMKREKETEALAGASKVAQIYLRKMAGDTMSEVRKSGNARYDGIFFDPNDPLLKKNGGEYLSKVVKEPHVTFAFNPSTEKMIPESLIGKEYPVTVVGLGSDGENHGYEVEIPEELKKYYFGASVPHITLSTSKTGKAVNTKNLTFNKIAPFTVKGKLGYFSGSGLVLE